MIPARLIRTVPAETDDEVERWWAGACQVHPHWEHLTLRDPIDPDLFPTTSPHWSECGSGAQLAGLVRLEALWRWGGVYIDSDVEVFRPFDSLRPLSAFAAYEDPGVIPDAVIGSIAGHPAIRACLDLALSRLRIDEGDWRTNAGPWATGPGVTTTIFPGRSDVLCLPPATFYPYHYSEERPEDMALFRAERPWAFAAHHWRHSWA
jgi:mannosyltransferase OCH1-like enzyme